jgi:hypothetical protein
MVLHLLPDYPDDLTAEIRLLPSLPPPRCPDLRDWNVEAEEQIITHVATGCRYQAIRIDYARSDGIVGFNPPYEVALRFIGMIEGAERPLSGLVIDIGREGIEWILTYTMERRRS